MRQEYVHVIDTGEQIGWKKCAANLTMGKVDTEVGDLPMSGNERDAEPGLRPRSEVLLAHERHDSRTIHPGQEELTSLAESVTLAGC